MHSVIIPIGGWNIFLRDQPELPQFSCGCNPRNLTTWINFSVDGARGYQSFGGRDCCRVCVTGYRRRSGFKILAKRSTARSRVHREEIFNETQNFSILLYFLFSFSFVYFLVVLYFYLPESVFSICKAGSFWIKNLNVEKKIGEINWAKKIRVESFHFIRCISKLLFLNLFYILMFVWIFRTFQMANFWNFKNWKFFSF